MKKIIIIGVLVIATTGYITLKNKKKARTIPGEKDIANKKLDVDSDVLPDNSIEKELSEVKIIEGSKQEFEHILKEQENFKEETTKKVDANRLKMEKRHEEADSIMKKTLVDIFEETSKLKNLDKRESNEILDELNDLLK